MMGDSVVRVVVVDDHPAMRESLRHIVANDDRLALVGDAATGAEALRLARMHDPDVMVLDLDLPDMSGVEVAKALRDEESGVQVVAFTAHTSRAFVEGLVDAGVAGYVTKDRDPRDVVDAIYAVARGEGRWFVVPSSSERALRFLSRREREVLESLSDGLSNAEIARSLSISDSTVRNHLSRIYESLGVESAREAIVWARRRGIGTDGDT